jgi:phage terminase large subunit GpA-like protein
MDKIEKAPDSQMSLLLEAWRTSLMPPADLRVSEWAELHRVLPQQSSIPGPWRSRLAPYTIGVMDAFNDPRVERITIMASVQSSKTESVYNMLGFAIAQDPAPALIVMPTLKTLKRVNRRIRDMLKASPELAHHLSGNPDDLKMEVLSLDRMEIYFATAGSAADLQNVEARYVILDETDEYPADAVGGSPIEMAEDRSTTYWNRKVISVSRPTLPDGYINLEYQRSDRRRYWVPCPKCGGFQVLRFDQVKHAGEKLGEWPAHRRDPEYIKRERVARYECQFCQAEIDDAEKPGMLAKGIWLPEGTEPESGEVAPLPLHVGFWWNVLYSMWRSFSEVAAQFFACKDDRDKLRIFKTQWLAEPWTEVFHKREGDSILELRTGLPPLVVPEGAVRLTAGIDCQKVGYWVVIRAWFRDLESHLVRYGFVETDQELERWLFEDLYHNEAGQPYAVWRAGMDVGGGPFDEDLSMTERAYTWLRAQGRGIVFGVKGSARPLGRGNKMVLSVKDRMPGRAGLPIPGGLQLWILDTGLLKDSLWARIEAGKFHLHSETGPGYARHLTSEVKQRVKNRMVWVQQGSQANHLLDAEIYAAAMADPECSSPTMSSLALVAMAEGRAAAQVAEQEPQRPGWLRGRGIGWQR